MKDVQFPRAPESIIALIAASAAQYGLDPALLQAVIKVESNFNSDAVSSKGAIGLMQLMPLTAAALHVLDPFDPKDNIHAGAALLRRLLNRFDGDLSLALAAYHIGETRVRQTLGAGASRDAALCRTRAGSLPSIPCGGPSGRLHIQDA
jgi:soluble lytic murein transglycosylase-like protein